MRNVMYIVYKNVVISIYCRLASKLINPVLRLFFTTKYHICMKQFPINNEVKDKTSFRFVYN